MYTISHQLYLDVGERLMDAIGRKEYFSGVVTSYNEDVECRLVCTLIVEREANASEGHRLPRISRLIPVWWECHTYQGEEEILNDFSFQELASIIL